ncbi:hypothetical protein BB560_005163 [Smittium megazygosporum]|uniref:Uncharacterized protein n=1 Tax=Smittium megazygosporum TaxID=133381 RepID=A0A2T9Z783_9FUNG|nr:hypothetical protein BB560_005163 [Smittium megazygosporum]
MPVVQLAFVLLFFLSNIFCNEILRNPRARIYSISSINTRSSTKYSLNPPFDLSQSRKQAQSSLKVYSNDEETKISKPGEYKNLSNYFPKHNLAVNTYIPNNLHLYRKHDTKQIDKRQKSDERPESPPVVVSTVVLVTKVVSTIVSANTGSNGKSKPKTTKTINLKQSDFINEPTLTEQGDKGSKQNEDGIAVPTDPVNEKDMSQKEDMVTELVQVLENGDEVLGYTTKTHDQNSYEIIVSAMNSNSRVYYTTIQYKNQNSLSALNSANSLAVKSSLKNNMFIFLFIFVLAKTII